MRRFEAGLVGLALGVFAIGGALLPLELPFFARALSSRVSDLPDALVLPLAEASRKFVVTGSVEARRALELVMAPDAVSHLADVHTVIRNANLVTLVLAAVLLAWALLRGRRDGRLASSALAFGAASVGAFALLAIAAAAIDFEAFFSAFHGLFFAAGTWTFPSDSILIRLFPEPFWMTSGLVWGGLVVAIAVGYAVAARVLKRRCSGGAQG